MILDCGGRIEGISGTLSPPTVGGNYTNNTWCKWTYDNPNLVNSTLVLKTQNYFIEDPVQDYCHYDWVQVTGNNLKASSA